MSTLSDKTLNLSLSELDKLSSSSSAYEQMLKEIASYYEKLAKSSEAQAQLLGLEYLKKLDEYNAFKVANKISAASEMMRNILKIIGLSIACIAVLAVLSFAAYKIFDRFKQFFVETLQKWRIKKLQKDLIVISKVFKRDDDYKEEITHELTIPVSNGNMLNDIRLNFTCFRNQEFSNFHIPACKAAKEKFQMNPQGSIASLEGNQGYLITSVGAPGLGKSHLTKQLCQYFAGKKDKSGCAYLELSIGQFVPSEKGLTRDDIENKFRTNMAAIFETIKSLKEKLNETNTPLVITITELDKFLGSENLMKIPRGTFVNIFFTSFIDHITVDSSRMSDKETFQNTFFTIDSNVKLENTSYFSKEHLEEYYDLQIQNLQDNKQTNSNISDLFNFTRNAIDGNFNFGQKKGEIEKRIKDLEQEKNNELQQLKTALSMFKSRARGFDFEFERLNKENFISALIDINDHDYDINYDNINKIMDQARKNGDNYLNSELSQDEKQKIKTHFLNGRNYDNLTTDEKNKIDNQVDIFEKAFNKLVKEEKEININKAKFARIFLRSLLESKLEEKIHEKINNESDFKEFGEKNIKNKILDKTRELFVSENSEIQNFNKLYKITSNLYEVLNKTGDLRRNITDSLNDLPDDIKEDIKMFNFVNSKTSDQINSEIKKCSDGISNFKEEIQKKQSELSELNKQISITRSGILNSNNNNVNLLHNINFAPFSNLNPFNSNQFNLNQGNQNNNQQILNNQAHLDYLKEQESKLERQISVLEDSINVYTNRLQTLEEEENFLNNALINLKDQNTFFYSLSEKYSQKLKDLDKKAKNTFKYISLQIIEYAKDLLDNSFFTDEYEKAFIKFLEEEVICVNEESKENKIYFCRNLNFCSFKGIPNLDPNKIDKKEFFSIREAQSFFSLVSSFFTKKPKKEVKTRRPSLFWSIAFKGTIVLLGLLNISSIFLFDEKILNTAKSIVDSLLRFVDKQNLFQYSRFFEIGFIVLFAIILLKIEMMIAEYIYSQDNQTSMMKDFRSFISETRKSLFKNTAEVFKDRNSIPNKILFATVFLGFLAADVAIILNSHKILPIFDVCTEKFLNLVNKPNLFQHFDKFNIGFICLAALFVLLIEAAITYRLSENVELDGKFFNLGSINKISEPFRGPNN